MVVWVVVVTVVTVVIVEVEVLLLLDVLEVAAGQIPLCCRTLSPVPVMGSAPSASFCFLISSTSVFQQ